MDKYIDLSPEKQRLIYEKFFDLKKIGLGYKKIIKRILEEDKIRISLSTLSYWANNKVILLGGENYFKAEASRELSYVLGVIFGDGSLNFNNKKKEYRVYIEAIDKEFVEKFSESISVLLKKNKSFPAWKLSRGIYSTQIRSKQLYKFLKSVKEDFESGKPFIEKFPAEFIQGLADSEGCTGVSARCCFSLCVVVANSTNLKLLNYVKKILKYFFGIHSNISLSGKAGVTDSVIQGRKITRTKDVFKLVIARKKDVIKYFSEISFSIKRKKEKLADAILLNKSDKTYALRWWQNNYKKIGKKWVKIT